MFHLPQFDPVTDRLDSSRRDPHPQTGQQLRAVTGRRQPVQGRQEVCSPPMRRLRGPILVFETYLRVEMRRSIPVVLLLILKSMGRTKGFHPSVKPGVKVDSFHHIIEGPYVLGVPLYSDDSTHGERDGKDLCYGPPS